MHYSQHQLSRQGCRHRVAAGSLLINACQELACPPVKNSGHRIRLRATGKTVYLPQSAAVVITDSVRALAADPVATGEDSDGRRLNRSENLL